MGIPFCFSGAGHRALSGWLGASRYNWACELLRFRSSLYKFPAVWTSRNNMNRNFQNAERGPWDFVMFGLCFFGFVFTLAGVIGASVGVAVTGLMAMCLALVFFGLQQ